MSREPDDVTIEQALNVGHSQNLDQAIECARIMEEQRCFHIHNAHGNEYCLELPGHEVHSGHHSHHSYLPLHMLLQIITSKAREIALENHSAYFNCRTATIDSLLRAATQSVPPKEK